LEKIMKFVLASVAAAFLLIAGLAPASANTAGAALIGKPAIGQPSSTVEKAGWRHRRWYGHRHYYRPYRWYRPWGWRHRHWHHRHWW
jgi:hypothetical protein